MADLKMKSIALLSSTSSVDMKTAAKTTLYTVPTGKVAYVCFVVIRDTSASLAGGTEYDIGSGASCTTWKQNVDLSSMTTLATDFMVILPAAKYTEEAAANTFGILVVTGSTAACTATIDCFGYLV